jgi:hypothetical protein
LRFLSAAGQTCCSMHEEHRRDWMVVKRGATFPTIRSTTRYKTRRCSLHFFQIELHKAPSSHRQLGPFQFLCQTPVCHGSDASPTASHPTPGFASSLVLELWSTCQPPPPPSTISVCQPFPPSYKRDYKLYMIKTHFSFTFLNIFCPQQLQCRKYTLASCSQPTELNLPDQFLLIQSSQIHIQWKLSSQLILYLLKVKNWQHVSTT